ncbi:MAG: hypothetical protein FJ100_00290 [Deltaproteobacteria bacterium]|nr:hypothetical protein [Deltaproteobacteria bacterium]
MTANPYAPPAVDSRLGVFDPTGVWRDGDHLVWRLGAQWPDRCLRCNGPVTRRYRRELYWHAAGWYLVLLLGPIPYIVVALLVRRRTRIEVGLCREHADARTNRLLAAWGAFVLGLVAMVSGCSARGGSAAAQLLGGLALVLGGLVAVAVVGPLVRVVRIDRDQARAAGVAGEYLDDLDRGSGGAWRV